MNLDKNTKEYSHECSERNKNKEVVFAADPPADNSKCKRYSTAKYDRRTRQKIREKIRLENFVFEQLRLLYNTEVDDYDCDIDMDELCALQTNEEKVFNLKVGWNCFLTRFCYRKNLGLVLLSKIKSTSS
uniref:PKC-activated phosphatase-1 inhibitor n=1 Tax=Trichobilharzia regenti TaxID=157069 RepID=A0AA85JWD1_TRIRE|nr:unnamed protein product [Trichobilharzia regenti]